MMPASTKMNGQCFAFPDVCKTPSPGGPVPIPYPNIGMCMQAASGITTKVKVMNMPAILQNTKIPMSSGDEAGSAGGGVTSNMIKGAVAYKKGSAKVKFEGKAAAYITCTTGQNGSNANMPAGAQIAPSQVVVMVAM
jgi:hypothetical protein